MNDIPWRFKKEKFLLRPISCRLLHSALMKKSWIDRPNIRYGLALVTAICLQLVMSTSIFAANIDTSLTLDEDLVYCNAKYTGNNKRIAKVLSEGSEVTLIWHIHVLGIRKYWLNNGIGGVVVKRQVIPDLVSRTWELIDQTSGITHRVGNLDDVITFLSNLKRFPVMDRTLLEHGNQYRLSITLEEHLGAVDNNWFTRWWGYEQTEAVLDFSNP